MLITLRVTNFAIISELEINFESGLNIISGETGAGKSILVGAVNLLLGGRASPELIRTGFEEARVEGLFDVSRVPSVKKILESHGFESGDDLLINRTISRTGRNRVFINGKLATVSLVQQITSGLVDISSQHEHQRLLNPETHLAVLDNFGELSEQLSIYEEEFFRYEALRKKLETLEKEAKNREEQLEFIRYQIREIKKLKLRPGEEEELEKERNLLRHAEHLYSASKESYDLLYGEAGSVLDKLDSIGKNLEELSVIDSETKDFLEILNQCQVNLSELAYSLRDYRNNITFNPGRLSEIESRLHQIQKITKKYGGSSEKTLERLRDLEEKLELLENTSFFIEETRSKMEKVCERLSEKAQNLSDSRKKIAKRFASEVEQNLKELGMPDARFSVHFDKLPDRQFTRSGMDVVEFFFSANPGEELKPLAKIASGGELSRIMLALKVLLSDSQSREILIFDEVDTGIGGKTASLVGRMLREISRNQQVICITHLPQIACFGDIHFSVYKELRNKRTETFIKSLDDGEREIEIARMLGGLEISEKSLAHARELLKLNERT